MHWYHTTELSFTYIILKYFVPDYEGDGVGTGLEEIDLPRIFAGVHYYTDHYHGVNRLGVKPRGIRLDSSVKLGEQVAVGVMADAIDRSFMTIDDSKPTFSPYLEYDRSYPANDETLDQLRKEADERGEDFLKR